jgi:hypothetical protein
MRALTFRAARNGPVGPLVVCSTSGPFCSVLLAATRRLGGGADLVQAAARIMSSI